MAKGERLNKEVKKRKADGFLFGCLSFVLGLMFVLFNLLPLTFNPSPSVVFAADRTQIMETIKQAVLAELVRSVSENVELDGIRILKGFDTLDEDKSYTVGGIVMDGYNGRNKIVYLVSLYDDKQAVCKVRVEAAYDVLTDIFIAAKPLSSSAIITEDDVYAVKQKNSRLPAGAITDI